MPTIFPLGVAAALVLRREGAPAAWLARRGALVTVAGAIALLAVVETRAPGSAGALKEAAARSPWVPVAVAVACAALCVGLGQPRPRDPFRRLLVARPLVALGRWSYGIYLWHFPIIGVLVWTAGLPADGTNRSLAIAFVAATPLSILAGAASYRAVDGPGRRWAAQLAEGPKRSVRIDAAG